MKFEIVLASGSPRRREMMDRIGANYSVMPSNKEEKMDNSDPAKLVEGLGKMKAMDIYEQLTDRNPSGNYLIIGADTVVAYKNKILGKPVSREDAFNMIRDFSGDVHHVYTGVCIIIAENGKITESKNYHVATAVTVTDMSDEEINEYIATGEPMDKAGAYAIQGAFAPYISGIEGDYYNIVGFPVCSIYHYIKETGIDIGSGERK